MRTLKEELTILLNARIPCIWVHSIEEEEVIRDIQDTIHSNVRLKKMGVKIWSHVNGETDIASEFDQIMMDRPKPNPKLREPDKILAEIWANQVNIDAGTSNLWILRGFYESGKCPDVVRALRDIKEPEKRNEEHYNPIIVISPTIDIPSEIAHLFRVIEYGLPDKELVETIVSQANEGLIETAGKRPELGIVPLNADKKKNVIQACMGLTVKEIITLLRESSVRYRTYDVDFLSQHKIETVKKTGILNYKLPKTTFDDIGGNENIKAWIKDSLLAFNEEAEAFGLARPKGYMSVGVAGCGKTAMAEVIASEMKVPLLELDLSKVMNSLVGQTEQRMAKAIEMVKSCAPCVFLIDEAEKLLGAACLSSNSSDGGVTARIMQALLRFMNDNNSGVYVVMTSNDISQLPPEFTRAGRLDAIWYFGLPTEEERRSIFKVHFGKKNRNVGDIILNEAVRLTEGYTGAEIKQVVEGAMRKAFVRYKKDGDKTLNIDDITAAINEVIPVSESSREKIAALENYCRTRARWASVQPKKEARKSEDNGFNVVFDDFD